MGPGTVHWQIVGATTGLRAAELTGAWTSRRPELGRQSRLEPGRLSRESAYPRAHEAPSSRSAPRQPGNSVWGKKSPVSGSWL